MTFATLEPAQAWFAVAAAAGLVFPLLAGGAWRRAGVAAGLLWIGGAAQLALVQPQWFQYIWGPTNTPFFGALWGLVAVELLASAGLLVLSGRLGAVAGGLRALGPIRILLILAVLLAFAVGASKMIVDGDIVSLVKQYVLAGVMLAATAANLLALGAVLPDAGLAALGARIAGAVSLPGAEDARRSWDGRLPWLAALVVTVAAILVNRIGMDGVPHLGDETAYLFQAQTFAHGLVAVAAPPPGAQAALAAELVMINGPHWFSVFPPGWPMVLALGVTAGVPWLVNPILGGLTVLAAHWAMRQAVSRGFANLGAVVLAASPWLITLSGSLMSHTVTFALMFAGWGFLLAAARAGAMRAAGLAFIAGLAMGLMFLARPVDGVIAGALSGLFFLSYALPRRGLWPAVLAYGLGCLALALLIFPYNQFLLGDPMQTPVNEHFDRLWHAGSNRMGFGADIGAPGGWGGLDFFPGHTPWEAVLYAQYSAYALNFDAFAWRIGSLAGVLALAAWGAWRRIEWAMAAFIAAVVGAYALYWHADSFYVGPRYWALVLPPMIVLTAAGLVALAARLRQAGDVQAGLRLGVAVAVMSVFAVAAYVPWRAMTRYDDFRGYHPRYEALLPKVGNALVFVDARGLENEVQEYGSALTLDEATLPPDKPIFLRDMGPKANADAMAAYPGRPAVYVRAGEPGRPPRIVTPPAR